MAVPHPNSPTVSLSPMADPFDGFANAQPAPSGMPTPPNYHPRPKASGSDATDLRVLWYSMAAVCAILFLFLGAILAMRLVATTPGFPDPAVEATARDAASTPANDAPLGKKFSDLSDDERKAFIDDLKARTHRIVVEARPAAQAGWRDGLKLWKLKMMMTPPVVLADHRIEPTEYYRLIKYGFEKGWVQQGEVPIDLDAIERESSIEREPLSAAEEALIANISLKRRKAIIDDFNRLYAKFCDPVHRRDLARGLMTLPAKHGITDSQLLAIRLYGEYRGWTYPFR